MRRNSLVLLFLTFLGLLVYFNSLNNAFHFDDEHHIYFNPHIRSLRNIPSFFIDPKTVSVSESKEAIGSLYRPLLMVTHAINYAVGGLNPLGYHLVNLGFHVGSAYLVYLILKAMLIPLTHPSPQGGEGQSLPRSCFGGEGDKRGIKGGGIGFSVPIAASLIFTVHPFNSEVVNYITARSSVMCAFFYLLAFYLWVSYRKLKVTLVRHSHESGNPEKDWIPAYAGMTHATKVSATSFYIASLLSFLLALLTKEIAITLPAMLLLYDLYFLYGSNPPYPPLEKGLGLPLPRSIATGMGGGKRVAPYLPFFLLTVFYLWLRRYLRDTIYTEVLGGYGNILNQIRVLAKYLQILLWPFPLSIEHDLTGLINQATTKDTTTVLQWEFLAALIALVLIIVAGIWFGLSCKTLGKVSPHPSRGPHPHKGGWSGKEVRVVSFFIFWYFIVLLPMIPIRLNAILQENRGYLAGVGFAVIVGIGIWKLSQITLPLTPSHQGRGNHLLLGLLILLIITYSTVTIQQNRVWRDDVTLWTDAVAKNPLSVRAYSNLGRAYLRAGRLEVAEKTLLHALDMNMTFRRIDYIHIRYDLTTLYLQQGKFDLAREHMLEAIRHAPDDPGFYVTLGNIYGVEKRWGEAIAAYKKALEVRPDYTEALARIGIIHVIQEMYHEAIPYLIEASRDKDYPRSSDVQIALKKSLGMVR